MEHSGGGGGVDGKGFEAGAEVVAGALAVGGQGRGGEDALDAGGQVGAGVSEGEGVVGRAQQGGQGGVLLARGVERDGCNGADGDAGRGGAVEFGAQDGEVNVVFEENIHDFGVGAVAEGQGASELQTGLRVEAFGVGDGGTGAAQNAFPGAVEVEVADVASRAGFGEGQAELLQHALLE